MDWNGKNTVQFLHLSDPSSDQDQDLISAFESFRRDIISKVHLSKHLESSNWG